MLVEIGTKIYRIERWPSPSKPLIESGTVTKSTPKLLRVRWYDGGYEHQEYKECLGTSLFLSEKEALQKYLESHNESIEQIIEEHHEALALRDRITKQLESLKETQGC